MAALFGQYPGSSIGFARGARAILIGALLASAVVGATVGTAFAAVPAASGARREAVAPTQTTPSLLEIPALEVAAPIEVLGIRADGYMESPSGPYVVGWYTFGAVPGTGGNAIFAGHRDWHTGVLGVFYGLNQLDLGDRIEVTIGTRTLSYLVTETALYPVDAVPVGKVVGRTTTDVITLITCEGTFNRATHDYSHRRIVRAALETSPTTETTTTGRPPL